MDVYHVIERDHREIDDLLSRLTRPPAESPFDRRGRAYLVDRLTSVASRHEAAEELTLWPAVRQRASNGDELADRGLEDERAARAVLDLLRFVDSEEDLIAECRRLRLLLREHIAFEETTVFPTIRRRTTLLWSHLAAIKFRMARRVGPTRPHPGGADRPAGLMTTGAAAAAFDHLRDLRHRARRHPTGFEGSARTDAIAVLADDHRGILQLLDELERRAGSDDSVLHETVRALSVHDSIERQFLYPAVRVRLPAGPEVEAELLTEHGEIARLTAKLGAYRFHDASRSEWERELSMRVRTHLEREEAAILPELANRMTAEELLDLGRRLETARPKALTRPHPHLGGAGLGARLIRRVLRPLDRTRDAVAGRRSR